MAKFTKINGFRGIDEVMRQPLGIFRNGKLKTRVSCERCKIIEFCELC